jgi:hypothetical protein
MPQEKIDRGPAINVANAARILKSLECAVRFLGSRLGPADGFFW